MTNLKFNHSLISYAIKLRLIHLHQETVLVNFHKDIVGFKALVTNKPELFLFHQLHFSIISLVS
jgi:hypothetical protein